MLHPVAIAAAAVLVVNDHVLKQAFPGFVTGKLSDVAGLAFFPLLLVGLWEVVRATLVGRSKPSRAALLAAVFGTGLAFVAVKTTSLGAEGLGTVLGMAQAVPQTAYALAAGRAIAPLPVAPIRADATDLLALPALGVALFVGMSRLAGPASQWTRVVRSSREPSRRRRLSSFALLAIAGMASLATSAAPQPTASVGAHLSSAAHLDAAHPAAIQRFAVHSTDLGTGQLEATAHLSVASGVARVTMLADDGGPIQTVPRGNGTGQGIGFLSSSLDECGRDSGCYRRYAALIELIDPNVGNGADVSLSIDATATFMGGPSPVLVPTGFEVGINRPGDLTAGRAPVVFSALYREILDLSSSASDRSLQFDLTGAARPAASGGNALVVATLRPETWIPGTGRWLGEVVIYLSPPVTGSYVWDPGAAASMAVGGDPTRQCGPSATGCDIALRVRVVPNLCCGPSPASAAASPSRGELTFVVEVRAIVLDGDPRAEGSVVLSGVVPPPSP